MPVDPRAPVTPIMRTADKVGGMKRTVARLATRVLPNEFVKQLYPGVVNVAVDTGATPFTLPASTREVDVTVTTTVPPNASIIIVSVSGDDTMRAFASNIISRTSTTFQVHVYSMVTADTIPHSLSLTWTAIYPTFV